MSAPAGILRRARHLLVLALVATGVLAPLALAGARWPTWWAWIAPEQTPMTWLQSVVLVLTAAAALLVALVLALHAAPAAAAPEAPDPSAAPDPPRAAARPVAHRGPLPWLLLSAGSAGLALDERFALHERIRDGYLAPRGVSLPLLTWIAPGDFLVLAAALVGLALLPLVLRAVSADRAGRRAFLVGVVLAAAAVGVDSVDPATWGLAAERLQQTLEEVVELGAGLCFLAGTGLRLLGALGDLAGSGAPAAGSGAGVRPPRPPGRVGA